MLNMQELVWKLVQQIGSARMFSLYIYIYIFYILYSNIEYSNMIYTFKMKLSRVITVKHHWKWHCEAFSFVVSIKVSWCHEKCV